MYGPFQRYVPGESWVQQWMSCSLGATYLFHSITLILFSWQMSFDCNARTSPDAAVLIDMNKTFVEARPLRVPDVSHRSDGVIFLMDEIMPLSYANTS